MGEDERQNRARSRSRGKLTLSDASSSAELRRVTALQLDFVVPLNFHVATELGKYYLPARRLETKQHHLVRRRSPNRGMFFQFVDAAPGWHARRPDPDKLDHGAEGLAFSHWQNRCHPGLASTAGSGDCSAATIWRSGWSAPPCAGGAEGVSVRGRSRVLDPGPGAVSDHRSVLSSSRHRLLSSWSVLCQWRAPGTVCNGLYASPRGVKYRPTVYFSADEYGSSSTFCTSPFQSPTCADDNTGVEVLQTPETISLTAVRWRSARAAFKSAKSSVSAQIHDARKASALRADQG